MITPPVLTLIDDGAVKSKIRGCELLRSLLARVPASMWSRTGLGKVFEDALSPALSYLPPLTDESEALPLLRVVYMTLLQL